jgi:hypothetical protein
VNAFAGQDLIKEVIGQVYTTDEDKHTGWGFTQMAKFEVNLKWIDRIMIVKNI